MNDQELLSTCQQFPHRFPDLVPSILRAFADGEITESVMQHGTHMERVVWAAILLEAASEDQGFLDYPQMVELFGKKWADRFRLGLHRLRRKILRQFATPIAGMRQAPVHGS